MRRRLFVIGTLCAVFANVAPGLAADVLVGRYQMVPMGGQQPTLVLLDTATGCVWQLAQNPETKRYTFVETDVENLHWTWGGGAQGKIAERIDASTLKDEQKQVLKQELARTACGWSPVVQTPPPQTPAGAGASPAAPPASAGPAKK